MGVAVKGVEMVDNGGNGDIGVTVGSSIGF